MLVISDDFDVDEKDPESEDDAGAAGDAGAAFFLGLTSDGSACSNDDRVANRLTLSCGRLGPATLGVTLAGSRSSALEYSDSLVPRPWKIPCSGPYASTS